MRSIGRRCRPRSVRAVMSTAFKAAGRKRLAAIVAVLLVVGVVVATVGRVVNEPLRVAGELLLVVVAVGGAWVALTTTKARRGIAVIVSLAAVVALIVSVINAEGYRVISVVVRIVVARRRRRPREVRTGHHGRRAQAERDRGHAGAGRHPRRPVHEPQVRGWQGGAVPSRGRVHEARHPAGGAGAGPGLASGGAGRGRQRRRRPRHGRRRRFPGDGRHGGGRDGVADGRGAGRHEEPPRTRPRTRP